MTRALRSRARRGASAGGFTLIEVILSVALAAAIILPLLAWMQVGLSSQDTSTRRIDDNIGTNLLTTWFPRDVQNAANGSVATFGANCSGGTATGGTVALSVIGSSAILYTVTTGDQGAGLWRRVCTTIGAGGTLISELLLVPGATSATVTCANRQNSTIGEICWQVTMTVTGRTSQPIVVTTTRRTGGEL